MKGIDIFCVSEASTAICSSMEIEQASSSSFSSSPSIQLGGRALDRHNPIICDGRRNSIANSNDTLLTPPRDFSRPPFSPQPHHLLSKSKKVSSKVNRRTKTKIPSVKQEKEEKESSHNLPTTDILKKSSFIPTDIVTRSFAKLNDLIAPPPAGSSRYLLGSDTQSQYFDGLPEIDPVYDIIPIDDYKELKTDVNQDDYTSSTTQATLSQQPKPTPTKQVVVLMVSLHCKGCEGKVRKHLSKMEGVTSFNIDYAAKKVTIEGDITLVGVLASVSKLKHAKFWTSQPPPPSPPPSPPTPPLQSPPSNSMTVASTSATTEMAENQLD